MNAIEAEKLSRRFWSHEAIVNLDLQIKTGSVTALLGPNGAGKSTTIKVLMNLLRPTSGSARMLGVDSRKLGPKEFAQIGYVSENQKLPDWMTVQQFADYCRPFYPTWDRDLERQLLRDFDLPLDRKLKHLSRGMLMKAALFSSLAYRPKLLVLDEPFSGLDPLVREELGRGIIEATAANEWTILISSHDIEEVERIADHIVLLDSGRVHLNESVEALQARFRRIEITGAPSNLTAPRSAWHWQAAENYISYIEPEFQSGGPEADWQRDYPQATKAVWPMTLREIFICTAQRNLQRRGDLAA